MEEEFDFNKLSPKSKSEDKPEKIPTDSDIEQIYKNAVRYIEDVKEPTGEEVPSLSGDEKRSPELQEKAWGSQNQTKDTSTNNSTGGLSATEDAAGDTAPHAKAPTDTPSAGTPPYEIAEAQWEDIPHVDLDPKEISRRRAAHAYDPENDEYAILVKEGSGVPNRSKAGRNARLAAGLADVASAIAAGISLGKGGLVPRFGSAQESVGKYVDSLRKSDLAQLKEYAKRRGAALAARIKGQRDAQRNADKAETEYRDAVSKLNIAIDKANATGMASVSKANSNAQNRANIERYRQGKQDERQNKNIRNRKAGRSGSGRSARDSIIYKSITYTDNSGNQYNVEVPESFSYTAQDGMKKTQKLGVDELARLVGAKKSPITNQYNFNNFSKDKVIEAVNKMKQKANDYMKNKK